MITEADFTGALKKDRDDRLLQLSYADWLEEHGDGRAELIRMEVELSSLPVFSDQHWETLPRQRELRRQLRPRRRWLETMGYDLPRGVFGNGFPRQWHSRWRIIRAHIRQWFGLDVKDVQEKPNKPSRRYDGLLPAALHEWNLFYETCSEFIEFGEGSFGPLTPRRFARSHRLLPFLEFDESMFAVEGRHLKISDPPVIAFGRQIPEADSDNPAFEELPGHPQTFTETVLAYLITCTRSPWATFAVQIDDMPAALEDLRRTFRVECAFGNYAVFESRGVVALLGVRSPVEGEFFLKTHRKMSPEVLPGFLSRYSQQAETTGWLTTWRRRQRATNQ